MPDKPQIEFPCDYPIKVIVEHEEGLLEEVLDIARRHDPGIALDKVKQRASRHGKYYSFTILLWCTGEPQLKRLFEDLKRHESVRMVL
ncbi:MAG TPA: DUF493 domain-containing protein [Pseudomonadales bacterium]|nr:DUF493 domain-containing protein [Pseudomonadales bacterium]